MNWYWIRRDESGVVTAAASDVYADLNDLRSMSSIGPIERVYARYLTIGRVMDERIIRSEEELDTK